MEDGVPSIIVTIIGTAILGTLIGAAIIIASILNMIG